MLDGGRRTLAPRGVLVLPDFIANARDLRGHRICGGTERTALAFIAEKSAPTQGAALDEVRRTGALPRKAAVSLAPERVRRAMQTRRWGAPAS
jgi:glutamate dehydrogenase (NAD(P)+)